MRQEKIRRTMLRRSYGVNAAASMTATGRVDLPREMHCRLEPIADSSCEPLERLIALEEARERGIDEATARTVLGME